MINKQYLCEFLLLRNHLWYQNMNGTMLSQIVWVMTLAHYRLLKVAEVFGCNVLHNLIYARAKTVRTWTTWTQLA